MKNISLKPVFLLTALIAGPVAQAASSSFDAKTASTYGLKLKFVGDSLQVESSSLPLLCAQNLSLDLKAEPVENGKEKLKAATSVEDNDLKKYSTKITPSFSFKTIAKTDKGQPELRSLPECISYAGNLEKADLEGKDKISKALVQPDEASYVEVGSELLKNGAYVKLENDVKRINCKENCNDTSEKLFATLKEVDRDSLAGIVAKLATNIDQMLLEYVNGVDNAKNEADLEKVRADLAKFVKDLDAGPLSDDTKKELLVKANVILVQGIPSKELDLCMNEVNTANLARFGWTGFEGASATSPASSDIWAQFRTPKKEAKTVTTSVAGRCVAFISKSMETAVNLPRQDAETKQANSELLKQLQSKNGAARLEMISKIDPRDAEIGQALQNANLQMQATQTRMASMQCPNIPGVPQSQNRSFQNNFQFTQCSILNDRYKQSGMFVQNYGSRFQSAVTQDQVLYSSIGGASYSNSRQATLGSTDPFSVNPSVFPEAARWNSQSGMNYQNTAFNPAAMYNSDWNRSQINTNSNNRPSGSLPVAIPLNTNGLVSQRFSQQIQS